MAKPQSTLTHPITGETLTYAEWCAKLGISKQALGTRVHRHKDCDFIKVFTPSDKVLTHPATGKTQTREAWLEELGINEYVYYNRRAKGWTLEEILNTPKVRNDPNTLLITHPVTKETKTKAQWLNDLGIAESTFRARIKKGLPLEKVLTPPHRDLRKQKSRKRHA